MAANKRTQSSRTTQPVEMRGLWPAHSSWDSAHNVKGDNLTKLNYWYGLSFYRKAKSNFSPLFQYLFRNRSPTSQGKCKLINHKDIHLAGQEIILKVTSLKLLASLLCWANTPPEIPSLPYPALSDLEETGKIPLSLGRYTLSHSCLRPSAEMH